MSQENGRKVHHVLGYWTGGASLSQDNGQGVCHCPRILDRGCVIVLGYWTGGASLSQDNGQGVPKILHTGGARFPDGVPIFLEKSLWGCQISLGAKYPVTLGFCSVGHNLFQPLDEVVYVCMQLSCLLRAVQESIKKVVYVCIYVMGMIFVTT